MNFYLQREWSRRLAGGVFRDENGVWHRGFAHNIGRCNRFEAEFWAILSRLRLTWIAGFRKIELVKKESLVHLLEACFRELEKPW